MRSGHHRNTRGRGGFGVRIENRRAGGEPSGRYEENCCGDDEWGARQAAGKRSADQRAQRKWQVRHAELATLSGLARIQVSAGRLIFQGREIAPDARQNEDCGRRESKGRQD
jgi:hypothetical protein